MFQDHLKRSLFARLHCILDEAAHAADANNAQLVHEVVKEAIRYGGVVREDLQSDISKQLDPKPRFWRGA